MESKVAIIAIIINDKSAVSRVNDLLHEYSENIVGRMGIPYKERNINVISLVIDATVEKINTLSGKLGMINGVSSKVLVTK